MSERAVLMGHLPAIYHGWEALAELLAAFEEVLLGPDGQGAPGLQQRIAALPDLFDVRPPGRPDRADATARTGGPDPADSPDAADSAIARDPGDAPGGRPGLAGPDAFAGWLAGWVAFTPHAQFPAGELRRILGGIVPLYPMRGTRGYLESVLRLCLPAVGRVSIDDELPGLTLGRSRVGIDAHLARELPHRFRVEIGVPRAALPEGDAAAALAGIERQARALVAFAKPAHTRAEVACVVDERPWTGSA